MKRHTEMRFEMDEKADVDGNVWRIFSYDIDWKKSLWIFFLFLTIRAQTYEIVQIYLKAFI